MVLSAVDSLEDNIQESFKQLGDDVVYISKMPWGESPHEGNYWKYMRRPEFSFSDYQTIKRRVKTAGLSTFTVFIGAGNVEYSKTNASNSSYFLAGTHAIKDATAIIRIQYNFIDR